MVYYGAFKCILIVFGASMWDLKVEYWSNSDFMVYCDGF